MASPIIVVDVETSGKKSYSAHILEVAGVVLDEEALEERDSFSTLVNPGEEGLRLACPEAMAVNGLKSDELRAAPPAEEAARALREFLDRHSGGKIHAFNNEFDLWFLARPPWRLLSGLWEECVMLAAAEAMGQAGALAAPLFPGGKPKWPRLDEAAAFFGVPSGAGHRALDDARTAARVYAEVLRRRRRDGARESLLEAEAGNIIDDGF